MIHSKKSSQKGQSRIAFLPIKPIYADRIIAGEKLFEFRRVRIKEDISHIIIYSSSPVKKIIGIAQIKAIKTASPSATWERTKHAAGISRRLYREYFKGASAACTLEIGSITVLASPFAPVEIETSFKVPQSFSYVDNKFLERTIERGGIAKAHKLIFVGGIHGVGKSTICRRAAEEAGYIHLTASDLINSQKSIVKPSVNKKVKSINENQDILAAALCNTIEENGVYILDGHCTLLDAEGTIKEVPVTTFRKINPKKLLIITAHPESIQDQLFKRDGKEYSLKFLKEMQRKELAQASKIGKTLGIDVIEIRRDEPSQLISHLRD